MGTSTPPSGNQGSSQHQAGASNTLTDKILFLLFVILSLAGIVLIYFNIANASAYITLGATIIGLIIAVLQTRPNFFENALKLSISSAQFLMIRRVVMLLVVIVLGVNIYQAIPRQHPSERTNQPTSIKSSSPPTSDNQPTGLVGLADYGCQINVVSFRLSQL